MHIREAGAEDAPAACTVLKRSIAELCEADHRNDPAILAQWLGNKTPENFRAWVKRPENSVLVSVENDDILAVGSVTDAGIIGFNYVSPDARFSRREPRFAARAGNARGRTRQWPLRPDQHRDGPAILPVDGLRRKRASSRRIWDALGLSDDQGFGDRGRLMRLGKPRWLTEFRAPNQSVSRTR